MERRGDGVALLACAAGLAIASNYYVQPLLPEIARDFGRPPDSAGLLVTLSQLGYLVGLVLFLPLGDLVDRRRLAPLLMALTGAGMLAAAAMRDAVGFGACLFAFGATAVVTQVLVTIGAEVARPGRGGRVVGTVAGGAIVGVVLARTAAGGVAELAGWRAVYLLAGGLVVATAALLLWRLPPLPAAHRSSYGTQMRAVLGALRRHRELRRACLYGAASFAAFSVLWSTLAPMLAGSPYGFSEGTIGLFGLAGAGGVLGANGGGRLFDRGHGPAVTAGALVLGVAAFGLIATGRSSLAALLIGIVCLDLASQLVQITNQSTIFAIGEAPARLMTAYMTSRFVGGVIGSAVATLLFDRVGWVASSAFGAGLFAGALVLALVHRRPPVRRASAA